jgi:hypothetical protein
MWTAATVTEIASKGSVGWLAAVSVPRVPGALQGHVQQQQQQHKLSAEEGLVGLQHFLAASALQGHVQQQQQQHKLSADEKLVGLQHFVAASALQGHVQQQQQQQQPVYDCQRVKRALGCTPQLNEWVM